MTQKKQHWKNLKKIKEAYDAEKKKISRMDKQKS